MTNLNEQLLPCPFCGGQAQDDFIEDVSYIIECSVCETTTGCQDNAAEAIAAWNRRAPAAAPAPVAAIKTWQIRYFVERSGPGSQQMMIDAMDAEIAEWRALAAAPPAPAAAPIVQPVANAIEQRTEQIRLAFANPAGRSRDRLLWDVEHLLAHIAMLRSTPASSTADAKDAARYQFLRERTVAWNALLRPVWRSGETLDAAIDAAITSSAGEVKP